MLEGQIVLVHSLFTNKMCLEWQRFMDTLPFEAARPARKGEAARSNARWATEDAEFAEKLWTETGLKQALADLPDFTGASGLSANLRLYRYEPGTTR